MALLQLTRSSEYANRLRDIHIYIDGAKAGSLSNGQTKDFPLTAGNHVVQAKIDWCSSKKLSFTVTENETKVVRMSSFAQKSSLGIFAAIYYITFGAGNYLNLEEVKNA